MEIADEIIEECFYQTMKDIFADNAELDEWFFDRIYSYIDTNEMEDKDYDLLYEKMYVIKEKTLAKILDK